MKGAQESVYGLFPGKSKSVDALEPFVWIDANDGDRRDTRRNGDAITLDPIEPGRVLGAACALADDRAMHGDYARCKVELGGILSEHPDVEALVGTPSRKLTSVRADCHSNDFAGLRFQHRQHRAGRDIIEPNKSITAGHRQQASIRTHRETAHANSVAFLDLRVAHGTGDLWRRRVPNLDLAAHIAHQ